MSYDLYGRLSETTDGRPEPIVIEQGTTKIYLYPVYRYDPSTGEGYWIYPDMHDYDEEPEIDININFNLEFDDESFE